MKKYLMFFMVFFISGCTTIKVPKETSRISKIIMNIGVNMTNDLRNEFFDAQSREDKTISEYYTSYPYEPEIIVNTRNFNMVWDKNVKNKDLPYSKRKLAIVIGGGAFYHILSNDAKDLYTKIINSAKKVNFDIIFIKYTSLYYENYPYQLNEINAAYTYIRKLGYQHKNIVMLGDSAGGNLVLASNLRWRDRGVKMPAMLVLLSPWTDLTNTVPSRIYNRKRDVVMGEINNQYPDSYSYNTYGEGEKRRPYVSPIYANYYKFPESVFELGSYEMLYDDSYIIYKNMKKYGVDAKFYATPGMFHVFQYLYSSKESKESIARIGRYLDEKFSR